MKEPEMTADQRSELLAHLDEQVERQVVTDDVFRENLDRTIRLAGMTPTRELYRLALLIAIMLDQGSMPR